MNRNSLTSLARNHTRDIIKQFGFMKNRLEHIGMGISQCYALLEIEKTPGISVNDLEKALQLEQSTVSRNVQWLVKNDLINVQKNKLDRRKSVISLTDRGYRKVLEINVWADKLMQGAFNQMSADEVLAIVEGLGKLANALEQFKSQDNYSIRRMVQADNKDVAALIRSVLIEISQDTKGSAYFEERTDTLYEAFDDAKGAYFLIVDDKGLILGGGGICQLQGEDQDVCELKNMYLHQLIRGKGLAKKLMEDLLMFARQQGFKSCYLETKKSWKAAVSLYQKFGFIELEQSKGSDSHALCDQWFELKLSNLME